jgi:hypothetical protein
MSRRPAVLRDRHSELVIGAVLWIAGAWCFWDAYEGRGKQRPFVARLLP